MTIVLSQPSLQIQASFNVTTPRKPSRWPSTRNALKFKLKVPAALVFLLSNAGQMGASVSSPQQARQDLPPVTGAFTQKMLVPAKS